MMSDNTGMAQAPSSGGTRFALMVVTALFFMWGFITVLNDILVPHLKSIFELNYAEVMLVQFAFFSAYFVFSLPAGKLIEWVGYQRAMVTGLCVMAAGALLFIAAASVPSFALFLTALIIIAAGMTVLQVSANPYVTALGPPATGASRLNLTQAFNSLGTTVGPFFGSMLILGGAVLGADQIQALSPEALQAYRIEQAGSVQMPYLGIGIALLVLAVVMAKIRLPKLPAVEGHPVVGDSVWKHRRLVLAVIGIFTYVGAEVAIGSFLVNYLSRPEIGGLTELAAGQYIALYWGGAMVGRFIGSAMLQKIRTGQLLGIFAIIAAALVITSMSGTGQLAMWSILAVGLFNSIMFPSIFALGVEGLGHLTSKGSSALIAAIVGGAIVPEVQGLIADRIGIQHAFFVPVICYAYIAWFAFGTLKSSPAR